MRQELTEKAKNRILECKKNKSTDLNLSDCELKEIPEGLGDLTWVTRLDLSKNQISKLENLEGFGNLEDLVLDYNQISKLENLEGLGNLVGLNLSKNQISKLENLEGFGNLENLVLDYNQISKLDNLDGLVNLTRLHLENNQISKLENLDGLVNLGGLYLENNQINKLENLDGLGNLWNLSLNRNYISRLENLEQLINLAGLHLADNQISKLESLDRLLNLNALNLEGNLISKFENIGHFRKLSNLYLERNQISEIENFDCIPNIDQITFEKNPIVSIKSILPLLASDSVKIVFKEYAEIQSGEISLLDCPLATPPIEIVKQGNKAIVDYFKQLEEEKGRVDFLFESKLLILGAAGAGKTSFAERLQDPEAVMPGKGDSTHGIHVNRWQFPLGQDEISGLNHKATQFFVNLWDFGGQDIYHGTHQFFFSKKSLYVLVADTREQKTDFNYWLNTIEQLSGDKSFLFVLMNKKEGHDWKSALSAFYSRYGNIIKGEETINLNNSDEIPALQTKIKDLLTSLPAIGVELIESWVKVREALSTINDKYISFDRFRIICNENGSFSDNDIVNISKYFDEIGVFTHYIDDAILQESIYLDSNWLVKTVYRLLDNDEIKEHHGRITFEQIKNIWSDQTFEIKKLIQLLEKFGLMYSAAEDQYIVPIHLKSDQPYKEWMYSDEKPILHFQFVFDKYMPKGIMSKLIVALNKYILNHDLIWERGLNISNNNTHAEIIEPYGGTNLFDIRISGLYQRDLLVIIVQAFEEILGEFKQLKYEKQIKCPCDECIENSDPFFFNTDLIENAIAKKVIKNSKPNPTIECGQSFEAVPLTQLLALIDYENVIRHVMSKNPDSIRRKDDRMDLLLQEVKSISLKIDRIIIFTELNAENHTHLESIFKRITLMENELFESKEEEESFFNKVEQYFEKLSSDEQQKLEGWQHQESKHKLKAVLNLGFLKYERELEIKDFKLPTSWKELKEVFLID